MKENQISLPLRYLLVSISRQVLEVLEFQGTTSSFSGKHSVDPSVECAQTRHQNPSKRTCRSRPQLPSSISHLPSPTTAAVSSASSLITSYPISSSKFGLGTEPGSYKTPLGKFSIEEKFGNGEPEGMIFEGRSATGMIAPLGGEQDYVLTRILWLSGLESHNSNTHDRFIYIHGTNQEDLIGTPASHGCIRLRNADMIELFDLVEEGDRVEIV